MLRGSMDSDAVPRGSRLSRGAAIVLLALAAVAAGAATVAPFQHRGFFHRHLGAGRWGLVAGLAALALLSVGLLVARLRRPTAPPGAASFRLVLYAFVGATVWQALWVDHFHPDLWAVLAGLVAGVFPLALVAAPRLRAVTAARPVRGLDLLAMNVVVLLVAGETALRLWARAAPSPLFETVDLDTKERVHMYGFEPGYERLGFACNSGGYYDSEFLPRAARDGRFLVASVGDSFSASIVPHPHHFTTVCEELLPGVEVYNFGVAAAGPWDYVEWIRTEVRAFEPDAIVACLFLGNDVEDARKKQSLGLRSLWLHKGNLLLWLVPQRFVKLRRERESAPAELVDRPAIRGVTHLRGKPTLSREELEKRLPHLLDPLLEKGSFSEEAFLAIERGRVRQVCGTETETFDLLFEALRRMRKEARDVPFGVLLIPDEFQVEESVWRSVLDAEGREDFERDRATRLVSAWLAKEGIPFEDLLPRLRALPVGANGRRNAYHLRDTHFNPLGNRVAGSGLADLVERLRR